VSGLSLSLVVTTVGRVPEIRRLARSVATSPVADRTELVVVDQSPDRRAIAAVQAVARKHPRLRWQATTSRRGVSVGRNAGLRLATGDVVGFPNDNTWYPEASLPQVLARFTADPGLGGLCAQLRTPDGRPAMLRWAPRGGPVRRRSLHRTAISPGLFLRRPLVERLGGFDERLGSGSPGRAQSGEETDLVLRALAHGARLHYDPELTVHNDEPRDRLDAGFVDKMAGYGVGQGLLWRRHRLPALLLGGLVGRKVVAAPLRAVRGQRLLARADVAWARGALTGYLAGDRP
jgi:GT2 family glycosyltransferase